jgi:hypothetical protein
MYMSQEEMQEKSYEESLAADIFRMIGSARESGLDLAQGFQNNAFSSPNLAVGYLFMPREPLLQVPGMPAAVKRKLKRANILATIDVQGKKAGINLICALDRGFEEVTGEKDILDGLDPAGVKDYREHLTRLFRDDLVQAGQKAEE